MSHYRSNLKDLEFNLFEVHRIQDQLGKGRYEDLDVDTARDILREIDRLAREEWADSFVDSDRIPLELEDGVVRLPDSMKRSVEALTEAGWNRLGLGAELGGVEVPPTFFWACQELLLGSNTTAMFYAGGSLFARVLFEEGTEEQRRLATTMLDNGWGGTMVLTEPDAGSDVGAAVTKARHIDGDTYHIQGVKRFITGGEHDAVDNIIHLVLARPEGAGPGTKGLSMFAVPKFLVNPDGSLGERNGVYATNIEKKMGLKGSTTCELSFGVDRPAIGYLVGGVHDGIRQMFRVIEHARMTIGTKSAATLSTGYLNALDYAKERIQGADLTRAADKTAPRVAIISHPDVRRMLMIQKAYAEGLRALWMEAAHHQDLALVGDDPEAAAKRSDFLLPLVKGYSSEKAYELLALSLQVFGGSGFTQDYPIEQYIRDSKIDTLYEGTTAIQALDLFFRKIARDQGQTVAAFASEITAFVKGTSDGDPIARERELLGRMLDDVQAHLGTMVGNLMASVGGAPNEIYKVGLQANALLESIAELTISYLVARQAEIASAALASGDDAFRLGKVEAARFLIADVAPKISNRRTAAENEDGGLMDLPIEAF